MEMATCTIRKHKHIQKQYIVLNIYEDKILSKYCHTNEKKNIVLVLLAPETVNRKLRCGRPG